MFKEESHIPSLSLPLARVNKAAAEENKKLSTWNLFKSAQIKFEPWGGISKWKETVKKRTEYISHTEGNWFYSTIPGETPLACLANVNTTRF